jgi:class 3 adenylate cyclase/tetratricopeptide (TPR) repeat protein
MVEETEADIAQRRHVTIVFSDLSESTSISARMEPEDYADLLQQLRDIFELIVPRHGGEIVRIDGDGVLCVFGYPVSHEDSSRRAVEAAIDLHNAVSHLDQAYAAPALPIQLHTGIHSGIVLVRSGDLVRGRFELLGDATNIAARLCDAAVADQILVSNLTIGPDLPFFQTGQRRHLDVKSRKNGLAIYEILGREPVETRFAARQRRGLAPFSGRHLELERLAHVLDRCTTGESLNVAIIGPAGIGKTRLANEFLSHSAERLSQIHRGYCESYLGVRSLQPFVQIIQSMLADCEGDESAIANALRQFSRPTAPDEGEVFGVEAMASALAAHITQLAANGPVILHIDDWQWADDASRLLFDMLAECAPPSVLLLLSARELDSTFTVKGAIDVIYVSPLNSDEAGAAIEGLLTTSEPFLVERIRDQAGGSPLFIEELCHRLAQGDDALIEGDRSAWLDMLIQSRFARLPAMQATLVKTASIIGHMVPHWLFEAVTGIDENDPALDALAVEDFLYQGETSGMFRFKHIITRDAIYQTVGLKERQALHSRVVEALTEKCKADGDEAHLEALAYHCGASGKAEQAVHYAMKAGDKALATAALDRAQAYYNAALDAIALCDETPDLNRLADAATRKFGLASVVDPSREQVDVLIKSIAAAKAREDPEAVAWAQYWLGFILYGLGEPKRAIVQLEQASDLAAALGDQKLLITIRATLGQAYATACDYAKALPLLDEAITLKRPFRKPGRPAIVLSYTLACRALVYADQGGFDSAYADLDEAIVVLDGVEHEMMTSVQMLRCAVCQWHGRYETAYELAVQSKIIADRTRSRYHTVNCKALAAFAKWRIDRDLNSLDQAIEATDWLEKTSRQQFSSLNYGWLTDAMVTLGRLDEARGYAAKAFLRARKGDRLGEAMAARAMARAAAMGSGHRARAHYLDLAYRSATARGSRREHAETERCEAEIKA